jgi:hypothetical protein
MRASEEQPKVRRRHIGPFLVAGALIGLLLIAFILSLAEHKLPELALTLTIYLFTTTLAVFVIGRMLAWRERRRWNAAKDWLHMILLETIDDLLKELLPAAAPREGIETVAYSPLQLLVSPGEKDLQSHIFWYATELGPQQYAELARAALSEARARVREMLASSGQLLEADITAMVMSFDQAIAAAIRHLDSAAYIRNEKLEDASHRDGEASTQQKAREADNELAFVDSIIVESVVDSAIKPKGWLEDEMLNWEGQSSLRRLRA